MVIYQMSKKYQVALAQSYNFTDQGDVGSSIEITRHFDKFWATLSLYHDSITDQSGVGFLLYPEGLGPPTASASVSDLLNGNRH
jgi:hypothetical protein